MKNVPIQFADLEPTTVTETAKIYSFPDQYSTNVNHDVLVFEKTVIVKEIVHHTGVSKSGKTWHSWRPRMTVIYSLKKERFGHSHLRVYKATPRVKQTRARFEDTSRTARMPTKNGFDYSDKSSEILQRKAFFEGIFPERGNGAETARFFAVWALIQKYQEMNPTVDLKTFPIDSLLSYMAYPALRMFPRENFMDLQSSLEQSTKIWLLEPDVRPFIQKAFGKDALRKDFIKAIAAAQNAYSFNICHALKNYVPVDWMIPLFQEPEKYALVRAGKNPWNQYPLEALQKLMKNLTLPQRKRLILEKIAHDGGRYGANYPKDAIKLIKEIPQTVLDRDDTKLDATSWKTLHDSLNIIHRYLEMEPQPVPQKGLNSKLDGQTYTYEGKTYTIRSPKINHELVQWGNELVNCIASYNTSVLTEKTSVFAVYQEDEKLYANFEVNNGRLIQFVQKFNARVPDEMSVSLNTLIEKALKKPRKRKVAA